MDILTWMGRWEPVWLFLILFIETVIGCLTLYWVHQEFIYDEQKDLEKKQKRTRTTKKTVTQPNGASITEESTDTVEPSAGETK